VSPVIWAVALEKSGKDKSQFSHRQLQISDYRDNKSLKCCPKCHQNGKFQPQILCLFQTQENFSRTTVSEPMTSKS